MAPELFNKNFPKIKLTRTHAADRRKEAEICLLRARSKPVVRWSPEETSALCRGVDKYGAGKWKKILEKYSTKFHSSRRIVDLVTKYKLLNRESSYYKAPKRDWIVINGQDEPEVDGLGEIIVISQKFPYDAAKKFAKRRVVSGERRFVIRVREAENINNVHAYSVEVRGDKIEMKKLAFEEDVA